MVIQIKVCQRFVCMIFVDSPHNSNEDHAIPSVGIRWDPHCLYRIAYHADEYTMLDGDKRSNVQPSFGVKQGCPLSSPLFLIYLNDVDSLAEGVQGAITGIPNITVTHLPAVCR